MKAKTIQLLVAFSTSNSMVFLPLLVVELGGSEISVGLIVAAYSTSIFLSSYLFGRAGDIFGRRKMVRFGLGMATIAFATQILAMNGPLIVLGVSRIFCGIAAGMYPGALIGYAYETKHKLGKFSSFGSLGFGIGSFTAGILMLYWRIFAASSLMFFIAFILALYLPASKGARVKVPMFPKKVLKENMSEYLSVFLRQTGAAGIWAIYPLFLVSLGANLFWIGVIHITNLGAQFVLMQFLDTRDSRKLVILGLFLSIVSFISFTLVPDHFWMIPTQVLLGAAWASMYVGALKGVTERSVERSTASGLLTSTLSIAGIIGPLWGGIVAYSFGFNAIMYIAALFTSCGFIIYLYKNFPK